MSGTIIRNDEAVTATIPELDNEISDPDEFAHYARVKSLIAGGVQTALCGKKWIPKTIGGATDMPVCPKCKELYGLLESME